MNQRRDKMRENVRFSSSSLPLLCCLCVAFSFIPMSASIAGTYTYTEVLPEVCTYGEARGVNDAGTVVGWGFAGSAYQGFVYDGSGYTFLPLPAGVASQANAINSLGWVAGRDPDGTAGFMCSNGACVELSLRGWTRITTTAINDSGTVVGFGSQGGKLKGFSCGIDACTALPLTGWDFSLGFSINNSGVVVGSGFQNGILQAFVCGGGACTALPSNGWIYNTASAVNDSGVVVGTGSDDNTSSGFIYDGARYTMLMPPGWTSAQAYGISSSGVVVGTGFDATGVQKAFVYSGGTYTELLPPGWTSAYALSINGSGVVVGGGAIDPAGEITKGFMATPTPPVSLSPEDEIEGIIDSIDEALAGEDCGKVHLKGLEQLLIMAAHAVEKGKIKKACNKLDNAYDRIHKRLKSKKACIAQLAADVQDRIRDVMEDLECNQQHCRH
jgi:probable HAF family extracellular repeat protein